MAKFKKGDWVRCVDDDDTTAVVSGRAYRVTDCDGVYAGIEGCGGMYEHRFEPWAPRVGERVRVVYGNGWDGEAEVYDVDNENAYVTMTTGLHADDRGGFTFSEIEPITDTLPVAEQPAVPDTAPLTIKAGHFYMTRDGRKVGPMAQWSIFTEHQWEQEGGTAHFNSGGDIWRSDGTSAYGIPDLVSECAPWTTTNTAAQVDTIADEYGPAVKEVAEPKFRVGDRVRLVGKHPYILEKHETTGTIMRRPRLHQSGEWDVSVDNYGGDLSFFEAELSLLQPAIVCRIDNGQPMPANRPHVHTSAESADAEARRLAGVHKGQEFAVFTMGATHKVERVYDHEWQRLAVGGEKINAIRELRAASGLGLATAKTAVEDWLSRNAA